MKFIEFRIGNTCLRPVDSETGELPAGIEEAGFALLYKVLWTDQEM